MLNAEIIKKARKTSADSGANLLSVLEELAEESRDEFVAQLAQVFGYSSITMHDIHQSQPAFDVIPFTEASKRECLILRDAVGKLLLVFPDPFDTALFEWAEVQINQPYQRSLTHHTNIAAYLAQHEETMRATDSFQLNQQRDTTQSLQVENLSLKSISENTSTVVKLVQSTLYDALKSDVSDIHLESEASGMVVKYRIDGVLSIVNTLSGKDFAEQIISRVKVMSELDISERRIPQDGRFKVAIRDREVDFRVSIMPSIFGEDAVLRVLDRRTITEHVEKLELNQLGFSGPLLTNIRRLIAVPYGMFLVTGPTGSGKTTTLYAAITETNSVRDKVVTIEDPVEYQLPGVLQIPVNEKKGLTFARGLRSILRHDPDKIMVGEIRDAETAHIAVQSALTGHLVFTTVHANNAFDVIGRFTHMEVDPYSFVSALNGVLAQRLVRIICPHCTEDFVPSEELLMDSGIALEQVANFKFKIGRGCGHCRGSGYRGRKVVGELLVLDDELRELIVSREPIRRIKEVAHHKGMQFIRQAALGLVMSGQTTLEEINRVTFVV
jgi:general secretion pathway protein E